jgi:hypothetical protein
MQGESKRLFVESPWSSLSANASGFDTHRDSISSLFECSYFNFWATATADSPTAAGGVLAAAIGGERWSNLTSTPYLYYRSTGWDAGRIHRVDFDNPRSLAIKTAYAKSVGAIGVGMWTSDLIDYDDSAMVEGFWGAFHPFTKPKLPSSPALQLDDSGSDGAAPPAPTGHAIVPEPSDEFDGAAMLLPLRGTAHADGPRGATGASEDNGIAKM